MIINFNEVAENKSFTLPNGKYTAVIIDTELRMTQMNKPLLMVKYSLTAPELVEGTNVKVAGRKINDFIPLDNSYGQAKLKTILKVTGYDVTQAIDIANLVQTKKLVGLEYKLYIKRETYQGTENNKIANTLQLVKHEQTQVQDNDLPF